MRALVIGRGSMGKRRIRDLTALGLEVESWDITDGEGAPFAPTWDRGFVGQAVVVVSTPPMTKNPYVQAAHNFFTEADVEAVKTEGIYRHFPSCTPLFTKWWPHLRDGPAKAATEYWQWTGQHIEDWHPGATAENYYALRDPELAIREMVAFELIWITKLYGPVSKAEAVKKPTSWNVKLTHASGVEGGISIDIAARPAHRVHESGVGGLAERTVLRYTEAAYLREMRAFVASVKGEQPWPYSASDEAANLEVLHTIESPSK